MPPESPFDGVGVYAIYYAGDFPAYSELVKFNSDSDWQWPIYVGQSAPPGARIGARSSSRSPTRKLHQRLGQHASTIRAAKNLEIEDFGCRYLVVDDIWIGLAESTLIDNFQPLWNTTIAGFGIHAPGSGRGPQKRSAWDTLHPGRAWAEDRPPGPVGEAELAALAIEALSSPPQSLQS